MRIGVPGIFRKLKGSIFARAVVIYFAASWLLLEITVAVVPIVGLSEWFAYYLAITLFGSSLFILWPFWLIDGLPAAIRGRFLIRFFWSHGPLLIFGLMFLYWGRFHYAGPWITLTIFLLYILVALIWLQMSNPFARRWMLERAEESEALEQAEQRLNWPMKSKDIKEVDIHIAPKLYYTFLVGIAAIVIIVIETLIGEFFDNTPISTGYFGASIFALGIAASMYPIHKRLSKHVVSASRAEEESGAADAKSVVLEVARGIRQGWKVEFIDYWYITIPVIIAVIFIIYFGVGKLSDIYSPSLTGRMRHPWP